MLHSVRLKPHLPVTSKFGSVIENEENKFLWKSIIALTVFRCYKTFFRCRCNSRTNKLESLSLACHSNRQGKVRSLVLKGRTRKVLYSARLRSCPKIFNQVEKTLDYWPNTVACKATIRQFYRTETWLLFIKVISQITFQREDQILPSSKTCNKIVDLKQKKNILNNI